jgi:GNAT superfamily N-acetyltransferase
MLPVRLLLWALVPSPSNLLASVMPPDRKGTPLMVGVLPPMVGDAMRDRVLEHGDRSAFAVDRAVRRRGVGRLVGQRGREVRLLRVQRAARERAREQQRYERRPPQDTRVRGTHVRFVTM